MLSSLASRRFACAAVRGRTTTTISSKPMRITSNFAAWQKPTTAPVIATAISSDIQQPFSTRPQTTQNDQIIYMPPNLRIDRRTSISPFTGLEKLPVSPKPTGSDTLSEDTQVGEESQVPIHDPTVAKDVDNAEDEEDMGSYYSLTNRPEPVYAIPLPQRLHVPIIDFASASEAGNIHLSEYVFGQDPIRTDILHRCVVYQRNKKRGRRNGGARTKTIGEVSGSGKKMRNQKGGGVARAGHKRPAHWRGGAKAHGPKGSVQNYETKLNKKVRRLGLRMALSQKLKEGNLILVNTFSNVGTYKTKVMAQSLMNLAGIGGKQGTSAYILDHVFDEVDENGEAVITSLDGCDIHLKVGCQNIFRTKVSNQQNINVYDILKHEKLVMSLSALKQVEERYSQV